MRSTLRTLLLTAIVIAMAAPAQASWLSSMLFGRHYERVEPGITISVDEYFPPEWDASSELSFRYHKETDKVFAGTVLKIGAFITTNSDADAKFAIRITDEKMMNSDLSGKLNFRLPARDGIDGLRTLGTFRGKYGSVELDTSDIGPGTKYLYVMVIKRGKYQKFSEKGMALLFAPPLTKVSKSLENASEATLRDWGLESYPTLEEVVGKRDDSAARFDVKFADGGKIPSVTMPGRPEIGRLLGVFTKETLAGVARIDSFDGRVVRSNSSSKFLQSLQGCERELQLAWVVQAEVYSTKGNRQMTKQQYCNLMTYPDGPVGSATFGLRNMVKEMFEAGVVHLNAPFKKNTSLDYQQMYQNWTAQKHTYVLAPTEAYVPEHRMREVRVVRLSAGGVPVVKVDAATKTRVDTQGLWGGVAYIIGQRVRRPDRIDVKNGNTISVSQSQQQQQEQQQQQDVAVDP